jgi:hypothetical protein
VTPLETVAELVARAGDPERAKTARSLAAREELKLDGFWQDLAGPEVWGERDSVASVKLDDPEDAARLHRALGLIAEDLEVRGLDTEASRAWRARAETG